MAETQDWHHSCAACCSPVSTGCLSCFCPCITYGRAHHRLDHHGDMTTYSCANGSCLIYTALGCFGLAFLPQMLQRGRIRGEYKVRGNGCKDCLCACFCQCCDVTLQDKEVEWREGQRLLGVTNKEPGKEGGMVYGRQ